MGVDKEPKKEKIPRQPMPEQPAQVRRKNFDEVPYGLSPEAAMKEAERCLQCKKPACVPGCPVEVDIPGFINLIREGDFKGSIRKLWARNSLPAVCGRVCPRRSSAKAFVSSAKKINRLPSVTWSGLLLIMSVNTVPVNCRPRKNLSERRWPWSVPALQV